MAWHYHAPDGVFRNRALSSKLRDQAVADTQFMRFAMTEPGFGKGKGQSVTITRIMKLPEATRISETENVPQGRPQVTTKQVSVSQWGFSINTTELEQQLTHYDPMNQFQRKLREQITLTLDTMCADALKLTPIKYVPTVAGGVFSTNSDPNGVSTRNLGVQDLRRIHDYMSSTLLVPRYRGNRYIGILSTRAARGLKNDPEYKDWLAPSTSEPLISGQLKQDIEGFSLFETNHIEALADLAGTSTTTGEAIFFGDDALGLVELMSPEIRMGLPEDLGRRRQVGWVGTLEAFLVWEQASMARAVHVSSD